MRRNSYIALLAGMAIGCAVSMVGVPIGRRVSGGIPEAYPVYELSLPLTSRLTESDISSLETVLDGESSLSNIENNLVRVFSYVPDEGEIGEGLGLYITENLVLTSRHVLNMDPDVSNFYNLMVFAVKTSDGKVLNFSRDSIVAISPSFDLALLKTDESFNGYKPVGVGKVKKGDFMYVSMEDNGELVLGNMRDTKESFSDKFYYVKAFPEIEGGDSGGPVVQNERVIGVNYGFFWKNNKNLGTVVSVGVHDFLNSVLNGVE